MTAGVGLGEGSDVQGGAGVVDESGQRPELGGRAEEGVDALGCGDVGAQDRQAVELLGKSLCGGVVTDVGRNDLVAATDERPGDGCPDAASPARDDGDHFLLLRAMATLTASAARSTSSASRIERRMSSGCAAGPSPRVGRCSTRAPY